MDDTDIWLAGLVDAFENFEEEEEEPAHRKQEPIRVPRIPYNSITAEEFEQKYSSTNTPIILGVCPPACATLGCSYSSG